MTKGHKTAKLSAILFDNAEVHPIFDVVKDSKLREIQKEYSFYTSLTRFYTLNAGLICLFGIEFDAYKANFLFRVLRTEFFQSLVQVVGIGVLEVLINV